MTRFYALHLFAHKPLTREKKFPCSHIIRRRAQSCTCRIFILAYKIQASKAFRHTYLENIQTPSMSFWRTKATHVNSVEISEKSFSSLLLKDQIRFNFLQFISLNDQYLLSWFILSFSWIMIRGFIHLFTRSITHL